MSDVQRQAVSFAAKLIARAHQSKSFDAMALDGTLVGYTPPRNPGFLGTVTVRGVRVDGNRRGLGRLVSLRPATRSARLKLVSIAPYIDSHWNSYARQAGSQVAEADLQASLEQSAQTARQIMENRGMV